MISCTDVVIASMASVSNLAISESSFLVRLSFSTWFRSSAFFHASCCALPSLTLSARRSLRFSSISWRLRSLSSANSVKLPWLIKCRAAVGTVADGLRRLSRRMPSAFSSHAPSQNGMSSSHWDGCAARPTASCRSSGNMLVSSIFCFSACGVPNCPKPLCVGPSL